MSVKEKDHVITRYETHLSELTEKITAKIAERDAIQPPRKRDESERKEKKKSQRRRRNSGQSSDSPLEDRLTDILKEVSKRSDSVRFSKDDFESFSEAQTQLDSLLRETVTEILGMKQKLRKRFAKAQSGKRRRSSSNKRRVSEWVQSEFTWTQNEAQPLNWIYKSLISLYFENCKNQLKVFIDFKLL